LRSQAHKRFCLHPFPIAHSMYCKNRPPYCHRGRFRHQGKEGWLGGDMGA
jgi:hypothetical protein